MTTPELSVVIPTFDRASIVARCLEHLEAQTLARDRFEVIVVDDHSSDHTPSVLAEWVASGRLPLRSERPARKGYAGGARNHGVGLARGERVLFLGDDILAAPDLLERHLEAGVRFGDRSVIVGSVRLSEPVPLTPFMRWLESAGVHHDFPRLRALAPGPVPGRYFYACNASVPRQAFVAAGGFDETIQRAWEDSELGARLARAGLQLWFVDEATGDHVHPLTLRRYVGFLRGGRADVARAAAAMRRLGEAVPEPATHPVLDRLVGDRTIAAVASAVTAVDRWLPDRLRRSLYLRVVRWERRQGLQSGRVASA